MSKPEWGVKRLCHSCSALYYDMGKDPAVCPKCNTPYDPETLLKSRRRMVPDDDAPAKKGVVKPLGADDEGFDDINVDDVDVDDALPEDDLGGDDDLDVDVDAEEEKES